VMNTSEFPVLKRKNKMIKVNLKKIVLSFTILTLLSGLSFTGCDQAASIEDEIAPQVTKKALSIPGITFRQGIAVKASDASHDIYGNFYMSVRENGQLEMKTTSIGEPETFYKVNISRSPSGGDGLFALWSRLKQKYVCVELNQSFYYYSWGAPVYANRDQVREWETFDYFSWNGVIKPHLELSGGGMWWCSNGDLVVGTESRSTYYEFKIKENVGFPIARIALKSSKSLKYVCADLDVNSRAPLYANRDAIGLWETFDLIDMGNNIVVLRAYANAKCVRIDQNYRAVAESNLENAERFILEYWGGNVVAFKCSNGNYLRFDSFLPQQADPGQGVCFNIEAVAMPF
jgi:hypothetical protein